MLSGGVDSVAVLKQLLEETDDKVYAHHIHLKNNEGRNNTKRYKAEAKALKKIVPYMKRNFRDFHYSESTIDVRQIANLRSKIFNKEDNELDRKNFSIMDAAYYHMIGGLLTSTTNSSCMYTGDIHPHHNYSFTFHHTVYRDAESYYKKYDKLDLIFDGSVAPHKAEIKRPFNAKFSKKENIEYLGKELMDMVWYCRHPINKDGKLLSCNTNLGFYTPAIDSETDEVFKCRSCTDVSDAMIEIEEERQRGIRYG